MQKHLLAMQASFGCTVDNSECCQLPLSGHRVVPRHTRCLSSRRRWCHPRPSSGTPLESASSLRCGCSSRESLMVKECSAAVRESHGHAAAVFCRRRGATFARQRDLFTRCKPVHVEVPLQLSTGDFKNLCVVVAGAGLWLPIALLFFWIHVERVGARHCKDAQRLRAVRTQKHSSYQGDSDQV